MTNKLIVSIESRLVSLYGQGCASNVVSKVNDLIAADKARGITTRLLLVDNPKSGSWRISPMKGLPFPVKVDFEVKETDPNLKNWQHEVNAYCLSIKSVIDAANHEWKLNHILILGGNRIVPFCRADNPVASVGGDGDTTVPTDNPYGTFSSPGNEAINNSFVPEISIGRLPDGNAEDESFLVKLLDLAIAQAKKELHSALSPDGCTISAKEFEPVSIQIATNNSIHHIFETSPLLQLTTFPTATYTNKNLHYFNLHGGLRVAVWTGQDGSSYPTAFGPALVSQIKPVAGSVIATCACFGANIIQKTQPLSCALTFLAEGAAGITGATTVSYGRNTLPPACGDIIADTFLAKVRSGGSLGNALLAGKQALAKQRSTPALKKCLLAYYLAGDPSHRPLALSTVSRTDDEKIQTLSQLTNLTFSGGLRKVGQGFLANSVVGMRVPEDKANWEQKLTGEFGGLKFVGEKVDFEPAPFKIQRYSYEIFDPPAPPEQTIHQLYVKEKDGQGEGEDLEPTYFLATGFFVGDKLQDEILVVSR